MNVFRTVAATALLSVIAHYSMAATELPESLPEIVKTGNVQYVTGGIGEDERNALEAVRKNYNLRILNADSSGAYTSDTHIIIKNAAGQEVVNTTAGPIFYAQLPNDHYTIEAVSDGQSKKDSIAINALKSANIHFAWKQPF